MLDVIDCDELIAGDPPATDPRSATSLPAEDGA